MIFEWDENKNISNIRKHGIDFKDSSKIFTNPMITKVDDRKDYKEKRWISLGNLENIVVILVYTKRGKNIRLISIRKANKSERKIYYARIKQNRF
jgi:uncharacterized DUF497 family protein